MEQPHAPSEELDLEPVGGDERAIPQREERAQVCAPPEQERRDTTRRNLYPRVSSTSSLRISERGLTLPLNRGKSAIALSEPMYANEPWCEYLNGRSLLSFARRF